MNLPRFSRAAAVLVVLILGFLGAGCALNRNIQPGQDVPVGANSPASAVPTISLPEPSATAPAPPPEPWGEVPQSFSFSYQCETHSITLPLYQSHNAYFQELDRNYYYRGGLPEDWPAPFYLNFLSSSDDLEAVRTLITEVSQAIGQDGDELVIALINLVQNLTYDCEKLFSFVEQDGEGFQTNFPYETLFTKTGVCGDTSILLGKILQELGYGAAYLLYDQSNHMALGIQCPREVATYVENQIGYCYIETTGLARIGIKPTELGGFEFNEDPVIIPISEGTSFERMISLAEEMEIETIRYGKRILTLATCQEIQLYREIVVGKANMGTYDDQLNDLHARLESAIQTYEEELAVYNALGCEGTLPKAKYEECLAQQAVLQQAVDAYELLAEKFNKLVNTRNSDLDRLNQTINDFNYLMEVNNQDCGLVFSEPIDVDGEEEEIH